MNDHKNHRSRLRAGYKNNGIESLFEHEQLEFLLSSSIPRKDTNVLGHRLIDRFGSIEKVFEASLDDLLMIEGIGEYSALQVKFTGDLFRRLHVSEAARTESYRNIDMLGRLLCAIFMGKGREQVYMLAFNGRMELIRLESIGIGSFSSAYVSAKAIVEIAIGCRAAGIIIAHNHPSGICFPSGDDLALTKEIEYMCNNMGVPLLEHFVIADNDYWPIFDGKKLKNMFEHC